MVQEWLPKEVLRRLRTVAPHKTLGLTAHFPSSALDVTSEYLVQLCHTVYKITTSTATLFLAPIAHNHQAAFLKPRPATGTQPPTYKTHALQMPHT